MSIESLDPRNAGDVAAVASLHAQYLGRSLLVRLGDRFLRGFYYRLLIEDDLIRCTICRADGRIVGFIAYTKYPNNFIGRGVRQHFVRLAWLMLVSVVQRPCLLREIWEAFVTMRTRREDVSPDQGGVGEGISVATAKEYRNYVVPETGKRLAVQLWESMKHYFEDAGFDRFFVYVEPSNVASNQYCTAMGCQLVKTTLLGVPYHKFYRNIQRP
jgi:ribosomal protein S18 acetylase RimI-like enzyme